MDTLGTITPQLTGATETEHRTEAIERLRYLAQTGNCGLVTGPAATGKSWCLGELASQLRREAISVAQLNLTAVSAQELPWLIASRLGSGLTPGSDAMECWMWLQDYAEATRTSHRKLAFLIDHIERADERVIAPLSRIMDSFNGSCSWIFAGGDSLSATWRNFLQRYVWLKVELHPLADRESRQVLSRDLLDSGSRARFTPEGMAAAQRLAQGKIRRLHQIAELAALASETDSLTEIDAELVDELAAELI